MSNLFFKAANFDTLKPAPKLLTSDSIPPVPQLESDSYAHWEFGINSSSLIDKVNGKVLTVQAEATVQPIYTANSVQLYNTSGNALLSDLSDTATQSMTTVFVVKASSNANHTLAGTLPIPNTGTSGFRLVLSYGKVYMSARPLAANDSGIMPNTTTNQTLSQISNIFVAMSINKVTNQCVLYVQQAGVESSVVAAFTRPYETSINKLSVGSAYDTTSTANTTFAEAVIFDKALTLDEIKAVAMRSKVRMLSRGLSF